MKRKGLVLLLVLVLLVSLVYGITDAKNIKVNTANIARVFDFDNDGYNDILAFSDRIDSNLADIQLYINKHNEFILNQTLATNLKHCALSYQDFNLDGNIDIFFSCLNQTNHVISKLFQLNENTHNFTSEKTFSNNYYGDVLFFDFNNNGYSEIISCHLVHENNLSIYYYNKTDFIRNTTPIPSTENNCNLIILDANGNGLLDIIQYTYDSNNFSLFINKHPEVSFIQQDPNKYFNISFLETMKIKSLKAFDTDNEGISDLYYVVDTNTTTNPRTIEFGYVKNNFKNNISLTVPEFNFSFIGRHPENKIRYSWDRGEEGFFQVNITEPDFILNGTKRNASISHNLLLNGSNYVYGDFFENSYDYNQGFGNMLYRRTANFSFPNKAFNVSLTSILPSNFKNHSTEIYQYKPSYTYNESFTASGRTFYPIFCDEDLNENNNTFEIIWPDNTTQNITIQKRQDCYEEIYEFTNGNYKLEIICKGNIENICEPTQIITGGTTGGATFTPATPPPPPPPDPDLTEQKPEQKPQEEEEPPKEEEPPQERIILSSSSPQQSSERITTAIIENQVRHTRKHEYIDTKTRITEQIRNLNLYTTENITVIIDIPKEIIEHVNEIQKINDFIIIQENPIIAFTTESLQPNQQKEFRYILPGRIEQELIEKIQTNIVFDQDLAEKQRKEIEKKIEETQEVVRIETRTETVGNQTIITLDIDVDKLASLTNVSIYQEIPKCLIEEINHLVATSDVSFEIIDADPLIVWHFDSLIDAQKIQLAINKVADDDCTDPVITIALARQIVYSTSDIDYKKVIVAALLIPAFALILILLANLTQQKKHDQLKINKLIKKIKEYHKKGYSDKEIRKILRRKDYPNEEISEALRLNAKNKTNYWFQKLNVGIHEVVLLFLIVLNILDFFHLLPGDVDYFKKIISWIILGYLLYKVSITGIITGRENKIIDFFLIFAFFLQTLKNLVGFAIVGIKEANLVVDLYSFIWRYNEIFETYLFLTGATIILIISIILSFREVREPSLVGSLMKKQNFIKRFIGIKLSLIAFFIIVFNLMFEWLAIAVDAFVLITTMIIIIFLGIKHHKKIFKPDVIEDIAEDAEKFYEKVISLFHYKKFLLLAISGMLILFVLTEIVNFIIPYITGIYNIVYFGNFDSLHMPLFNLKDFFNPELSLFAQQMIGLDPIRIFFLFLIYLLNVIGILYLLLLPGRVWYNYFKQKEKPLAEIKHFILKPAEITIFITSIIVLWARPIFSLNTLRTHDVLSKEITLIGVDILTSTVEIDLIALVIFVALMIGVLAGVLAYIFKKVTSDYVILASLGFFTYYLYLFMKTQLYYYTSTITSLYPSQIFIVIYLCIFMILKFLFLFGLGYITVLYLYLPRWYQKRLKHAPVIGNLLTHQEIHHVEHRNKTQEDHIEKAGKYIKKSLESGHELFVTVQHLEEKGYSVEEIETAVQKVVPDEALWKGLDHYKHYHHNKHIINALKNYIKKEYEKKELKEIIKEILNKKFTEQEIIQALKFTAKKPKKLKSKSIANQLDKNWKELNNIIIKAEARNVDFSKIHGSFYFVKKKEGAILAENVADYIVHKYSKFSEFVEHLRMFKFTEEDLRVALRYIKPKNAYDEEIIKWV